jgi:hypothetical protein
MRMIRNLVTLLGLIAIPFYAQSAQITTIPHAVGLYFSEEGQRYFSNNLDQVIRRNGINLDSITVPNQRHQTGQKTIAELFPTNPAMVRLVTQVKTNFARFFRSHEIVLKNKHDFVVTAEDIEVLTDWSRLGLDFDRANSVNNEVAFNLILQLNSFQLKVSKVRAEDLIHSFFEQIGANNINFSFGHTQTSEPLRITIPFKVKVNTNGSLSFRVSEPQTNLTDVRFVLDYNRPLLLPRIEIIVNGTRGYVRLDEVERTLRSKHNELIDGLKKTALEYLDSKFGETVDTILTEKANANFNTRNYMLPLGAPNPRVSKMYYTIKPAFLGYRENYLYFGLNSFISDPKEVGSSALDDRHTGTWGAQVRTLDAQDFDVAMSLNQGMINRLLQLSRKRGYYNTISTASGVTYSLVEQPMFALAGRVPGTDIPPALKLKILYNVDGFSSMAVNNPIQIEFELKVKTVIKNGKVQLITDGVNSESVYVPRSAARWEFLWPKVLSSAREQLTAMNNDLKGIMLSDNLPLPTDILGFPMTLTKTSIDPNGNIMIFMNYPN